MSKRMTTIALLLSCAACAPWTGRAPQHGVLAKFVGEWKVDAKFWVGPDRQEMTLSGRATGASILGGNYVEIRTRLGGDDGDEGRMLIGYDTIAKEYVVFWLTAEHPVPVVLRGAASAEHPETISVKGGEPDVAGNMSEIFWGFAPLEKGGFGLTTYINAAITVIPKAELLFKPKG